MLLSDAWKTGGRRRAPTKEEAEIANLPMYAFEPSLSLNTDDRISSILDEEDYGTPADFESAPSTTHSVQGSYLDGDTSVVLLSPDGVIEVLADLEEGKPAASLPQSSEETSGNAAPTVPETVLPTPNSCPRSATPQELRLEDYLCSCKYCPRAVTIQRAFQLYGFALDHPQSESLLRVLRACANYDETVIEVDPLLVLHAEKMLEELNFDEEKAFRLLVASHFHPA
ncbi:hypothetical protein BBJ28_00016286 [Nothophytophthora sp. Chile5]|nr:hypothetical protein BBJ28_00016286 [Nothophytophthora sp. Chile5]